MTKIGKTLVQINFLWNGSLKWKGVKFMMKKLMCMGLACMIAFSTLCVGAGAVDERGLMDSNFKSTATMGMKATGSFKIEVSPYGKSEADTTFPLEAGETVTISAVYSPDNASMDFGLVDPDGVFHYFNVTDGSIDKTIRVSESGHYTFAVRNNSGNTVRVSGFVNY